MNLLDWLKLQRLWIFSLALCICIFLFGCSTFRQIESYQIQKEIVFKTVENLELKGDLYVPEKKGPKPAVLVVHGGGWSKKSGDMEALSRRLAREGFVVFNISYRLSPKNLFPKAVEDVQDALTWLQKNASQYQIDPNQISGWGYSAGAHLILLVGLNPERNLRAIIAGGTPADLTAWPNSPLVNDFLGYSLKDQPELWKEASPIYHVKENSPPVFLYHGAWDKIVEIEQMHKMEKALKAKNIPVETFTVPLMGHIAVYFWSEDSIDRGVAFIDKHLNVQTAK